METAPIKLSSTGTVKFPCPHCKNVRFFFHTEQLKKFKKAQKFRCFPCGGTVKLDKINGKWKTIKDE